jgi:hypothetical protein
VKTRTLVTLTLLAGSLLTRPAHAGTGEADLAYCKSQAKLARVIVTARDTGVAEEKVRTAALLTTDGFTDVDRATWVKVVDIVYDHQGLTADAVARRAFVGCLQGRTQARAEAAQ